jgi:hypothetical protein
MNLIADEKKIVVLISSSFNRCGIVLPGIMIGLGAFQNRENEFCSPAKLEIMIQRLERILIDSDVQTTIQVQVELA